MVEPTATVKAAAHKMRALDVGMLPVYNGKQPLGVITDRDIAIRSASHGDDPSTVAVSRVMTTGIVSCLEDDDVETAAGKMEAGRVRRLLVLDRQGCLVGVLSLGDLAARGGKRLACEALDRIVEST